jgi:putative transposase
MKSRSAEDLVVSAARREELQLIARSQRLPAALARRAQMILRMVDGESNSAVARRFGVSRPTVTLWRARFRERGIEGLQNESKPGRPRSTREDQIAGLIVTALGSKPQGKAHWSGRGLAAYAGLPKTTVHRYLSLLGVQPNRSAELPGERLCLDQPRAIAGLYLSPPDHVLAICSDTGGAPQGETTAAALLAALERANASVLARHPLPHRQQQLLAFLQRIEAVVPEQLDVQLICGYEAAPQRSRIRAWLARRPRFQVYCIPTYCAWLSRVEREFAASAAQLIGPGFFDSVADVKRKIGRFVEHYAQHPRPFSWPAAPCAFGGAR